MVRVRSWLSEFKFRSERYNPSSSLLKSTALLKKTNSTSGYISLVRYTAFT